MMTKIMIIMMMEILMTAIGSGKGWRLTVAVMITSSIIMFRINAGGVEVIAQVVSNGCTRNKDGK